MKLLKILILLIGTGATVNHCDTHEADSAIHALHDDLDDDDDGSISSNENRAFISEYGGAASSIWALVDDNDGLVSKEEFLKAWKRSTVHNWSTDEVVTWIRGPDLGFPSEIAEQLAAIFRSQRITGKCFPLLAKLEQTFLKNIGIRQHLLRRKIALRSMDAILFGPPVNDTFVKDLILGVLAVLMVFSITFIIRLKSQFRDVKTRLRAESSRLQELDNMWMEYNEVPLDHDSVSTVLDLPAELSTLTTIKRENEQLRASLEEAHKEMRKMQDGGVLDRVMITSDLKQVLQRTYRAEKQNLDFRKREARRKEHLANENMKKLERANTNFFSSVRLLHSHQLDHLDAALMQAHQAIEGVVSCQKDSHDRWRRMEKIFNLSIMHPKSTHEKAQPNAIEIYQTPHLSDRHMNAVSARSLTHHHPEAMSEHQEHQEHPIPVQFSPVISQPGNQGSLHSIFTESTDTRSSGPRKCLSELNANSIASAIHIVDLASTQSSLNHVKIKKPRFKFFDRRKLSYLSFKKNKSKKEI